MRRFHRVSISVFAALATLGLVVRADAPHVYAIQGARIVTATGAPIASGTLVIRGGLIDAVGTAPAPADARVIDGKGLTVYPGLIDLGSRAGLEPGRPRPPENARTREEIERWKRGQILQPQTLAATLLDPDAAALKRLAAAGITTALVLPPGEVVGGHSALVNTGLPEEDPQIGDVVSSNRRGEGVLRTPVALHVAFPDRPLNNGNYPGSLMGVIAFVRQAFADAQHYQLARLQVDRGRFAATDRPAHDPALEAMQPALERKVPVVLEANSLREILRALKLAREFTLDPVVAGGREADQAIADLTASGARVIYSLDYPTRPRTIAPDADEPLRVLRARAHAPKTPAALEKAGVLFAFESAGLREPADFVKNAARAVKEGLPADAAIRALTINAAKIAGAGDRLGTIEKGKLANLIVTDGDLFDEKMKIRHVFVDGRLVKIEPPAEREVERRRGGS